MTEYVEGPGSRDILMKTEKKDVKIIMTEFMDLKVSSPLGMGNAYTLSWLHQNVQAIDNS